MGTLLEYLLNGLMQGTIYGLVAMGFTIFFGVMNVIKFSHGDVFAFGAFGALVAAWTGTAFGLSAPVTVIFAFLAAMITAGLLGGLIARILILPVRNAPSLNLLLMTMMAGTVIRECIRLFFPNGSNPQRFPALLPSGGLTFGSVYLRWDGLILTAAGLAAFALVHWIINRTRFGLAMRAVAEDEEIARVMGIDFTLIVTLTFAVGSMTAGFAGTIYGLYYSEVNFSMGLLLGIIGFGASIVGGLGNIWGAILGGYLFAGLQTAVVALIPSLSDYKTVIAFLVFIVLITWRPTGLMAERSSERV